MNTRILAAVATVLFLASCGGGGGGDSPMISMPATTTPTDVPVVSAADVQSGDPDSTLSAATRAAVSLPAFGSVTQSVNRDGVSGVSTDRTETSVDGDDFTLTINRQGGSPITLSTVDDYYIANPIEDSSIPGHDASQDGYILDYSPQEATVAYVIVSWDSDDPMDYLSGGYWLHVKGDSAGDGSDIEIDSAGAFVDGPELSMSNRPTMPIQGTASYVGVAEGLYGARYGTDVAGAQVGDTDIGLFNGDATLTADFSAGTISGCVGCNGGISANGETTEFRMRLGATPFESNGTFRGASVALESTSHTITSTSGAWGGMFSSIPDSDGDPRLVAGTVGGEATTSGGSEVVFVGAYYAVGQ